MVTLRRADHPTEGPEFSFSTKTKEFKAAMVVHLFGIDRGIPVSLAYLAAKNRLEGQIEVGVPVKFSWSKDEGFRLRYLSFFFFKSSNFFFCFSGFEVGEGLDVQKALKDIINKNRKCDPSSDILCELIKEFLMENVKTKFKVDVALNTAKSTLLVRFVYR